MRVVHLLNDVRDVGNGINNITVDLACAQAAAGLDVTVVSAGGGLAGVLDRSGVGHVDVGTAGGWRGRTLGVLHRYGVARRLRPDVVHVHNLAGTVPALALRALHRVPWVSTVHLERKRGTRLLMLADAVLFFSERARDRAGSPMLAGLGRRARVVYQGPLCGARLAAMEPAAPVSLASPAVVTVCGLYRHKGVHDLVAAMVLVNDGRQTPAHLHVVGHGPERAALEAAVAASGQEATVHLEGFRKDPRPWMAAADVFVLASHSDPAPLVLAEARAVGAAVVATDVDGIPTLLDGGAAAELVPPGDPAALAAAVAGLLDDPGRAGALRERSRDGLDRLSIRRYADDVTAVYGDALR